MRLNERPGGVPEAEASFLEPGSDNYSGQDSGVRAEEDRSPTSSSGPNAWEPAPAANRWGRGACPGWGRGLTASQSQAAPY